MSVEGKSSPPFPISLFRITLFIKNELRKNWISFLIPVPILILTAFYFNIQGHQPLRLGVTGSWSYLAALFFMALVYGLQCFSSEVSGKTLDFLLTRPLSPLLIIAVKYLTSLCILSAWVLLSKRFIKISPYELGLPQEMGFEWIILILMMVHALSCFSSVLAKGLERLLVIVVISGAMAGLSYYFWWRLFHLLQANYYLPDVPPGLDYLVVKLIPVFLSLMGLLMPFTGTWWILKNRINPWHFPPLLFAVGLWLAGFGLIILSEHIFGPVLWPVKTAKYGDWHQKAGIVTAGPLDSQFEFGKIDRKALSRWVLLLSRPGQKAQPVYQGYNLGTPRFSPDGKLLVFSEKDQLKIMNLENRAVQTIGSGKTANWSRDGKSLIFAREIGAKNLSKLYTFQLNNQQITEIPGRTFNVSDLAWDSRRSQVFIFSYLSDIYVLNLKTLSSRKLNPALNKYERIYDFSVFPPSLALNDSAGILFVGQVIGRDFYLYAINLKNNTLSLSENKTDFRIKSGAPLIINHAGTYLLWPRIDGGFEYQSTYYNFALHDTD